jgi:hypothetical protein
MESYDKYAPSYQVDWSNLEVGREYFHSCTLCNTDFQRFIFKNIWRTGDNIIFVLGEEGRHAFAVGDWAEIPDGAPKNRFWTTDVTLPEKYKYSNKNIENNEKNRGRRRNSLE